ncbi:MAG: glycoside hydrolase family 43 protein, partial [Chloroflexaceae bacterium]|nr:glycoside hydrolase family 43 protein [Chloroflexaceae bacterium]
GIIRSHDMVQWQPVGGALEPLPGNWPHYWAPEVTYHNGRFYMYYSLGDEVNMMQVRVAVASSPAGPFVDSGHRLTPEPFAIDAHVFIAADGSWHLFYATDFLEHSHIGTGTVRARMASPFTLAEPAVPVTRARYDWQVYDPQRANKGGVRWHTVEGPFVLERKGLFYQMFSGGNWQNLSYGVSYATSNRIDPPDEWAQVADGEQVLPVLRTIPDQLIGPGHNSVVRGPDNRQLFCVYHHWSSDASDRVMAIDRQDWTGERLLVFGPSTTPQPAPPRPALADHFDGPELAPHWRTVGGSWAIANGALLQTNIAGDASATCTSGGSHFLAEVSLKQVTSDELRVTSKERSDIANPDSSIVKSASRRPDGQRQSSIINRQSSIGYGLRLSDDLHILLEPTSQRLRCMVRQEDGGWHEELRPLPPDFDFSAYHLLWLDCNGQRLLVSLDERTAQLQLLLPTTAERQLVLCTSGTAAAFAGFALTLGWEDLFDEDGPAEAWGWQGGGAGWHVAAGELQGESPHGEALLTRGPAVEDYELVVSARLAGDGGSYGIAPALQPDGSGPRLRLAPHAGGWALHGRSGSDEGVFPLPPAFNPQLHQHFRFHKHGTQLTLAWENQMLGQFTVSAGPAYVGLLVANGAAAFDMVRVAVVEV